MTFPVGTRVFDAWWPLVRGVVKQVSQTRTRVDWENGKSWNYDRAHSQFLRRVQS
jgi:hypothetical protein